MLLSCCLSAALGAAIVNAQWSSTSTEFVNSLSCTTEYGSSWVAPIPTNYSRFTTTISSVAPAATYTSTVYVTANTTTAYPITSWSDVRETSTVVLDATTVTVRATHSSTIGTITHTATECTNGVTPSTTATSYTGVYTPISGQDTILPSTYETLDVCTLSATVLEHIFPTSLGPTTTSTVPISTASPTIHITTTYTATTTSFRSTVTTTLPAYSFSVAVTTTTLSTACSATATATYEARCAPQNLIAAMDGYGLDIDAGSWNANFTFAGGSDLAHGDPGLCCQLCVEAAGCAASIYWAQSSSCLLGYVGGAGAGGDGDGEECPVAFTYAAVNYTEVPTKPREGNIFQSGDGCGRIVYSGVRLSS